MAGEKIDMNIKMRQQSDKKLMHDLSRERLVCFRTRHKEDEWMSLRSQHVVIGHLAWRTYQECTSWKRQGCLRCRDPVG